MSSKSYHHGNLREELITEAMRILREQDMDSITLRKLSNSLDVSKAAPYRHFESKADLLAAVAARGFRSMRNSFEEDSNSHKPEVDLGIIMERYVTFAIRNPKLYKLMFSKEVFSVPVSEELFRAASDAYAGVKAILGRMNSKKKAAVSVNTVWALVHGLSLLINDNLLAIDEKGNTGHALFTNGGSPTSLQIADQISSAVAVIVNGFSAIFSQE